MKKIKCILIFAVIFHILITFLINISSLSILKEKKNIQLNSFALYTLKDLKRFDIPTFIKTYSNMMGIDRGYGYYSPNITNKRLDISVVDISNNRSVNVISSSFESKLKYNTMLTNLHVYTAHYKDRRLLINSFSEYIFYKQPNINSITLKVNIFKINNLQEYSKSNVLFTKQNVDSYIIDRKNN